ncbi:MAG TPA: insulinase family protein, partial [Thermomicrobiales bacterium]|nr:insulinase family protein [Thermomicrobiales bacterium]
VGESVRERQGMAYYAYAAYEAGRLAGVWSARAGVNPANVERAIEAILVELRGFLEGGPTEREMTDAVSYLTGSLPIGLETAGNVASVLADIGFHELGLDYLQRYRAIVRAQAPEELIAAMRRHVDPDALRVVVVAPEG